MSIKTTLRELLSAIADEGLTLRVDGNELLVSGPRERLTPQLQDNLRARRAELVRLLRVVDETTGENGSSPPLERAPRDVTLPLSFSEERLWFLGQLEGPSNTYNLPSALRLRGPLNLEAVSWSIDRVVQRHEILRTTYRLDGESLMRVIEPQLPIAVPVTDLAEWAARAAPNGHPNGIDSLILNWVRSEAVIPFNLQAGPLLRINVFRLSDCDHVLFLNMHHIISDAWSVSILVREFSYFYEAQVRGVAPSLPPLPIQYADFAWWQRHRLQDASFEQHQKYWVEKLSNAPPLIALPLDHPRPLIQTYDGTTQAFTVPAPVSHGLIRLARAAGTTNYVVLLTAFKVLLARYCLQDDIVVGSTFANRTRRELDGLIGFFVNTLALRTPAVSGRSFRELLAGVTGEVLEAHSHCEIPFERIVEAVQPERSLSHSPLVQVIFDFHNVPEVDLHLPKVSVEPVHQDGIVARFDLVMDMRERAGVFEGVVEYNTNLFEAATIRRLIDHFQSLLTAIVADPDARVETLAVITARERHRALAEWNNTARDYPRGQSLSQLFTEQASRTPDAIAADCDGASMTYRTLDVLSNRVALTLLAAGVRLEDRVGLFLDRGLEYLIALLGTMKVGAAFVPLDPSLPPARTQEVLNDCSPAQIIVLSSSQPSVKTLMLPPERLLCLDVLLAEGGLSDPPVNRALANSLAYVIYTSGSTGKPKGVMIEHEGMLNHIFAHIYDQEIEAADVMGQIATQTFDISVWQLLCPLMVGGRTAIITGDAAWEPVQLIDRLEREDVTIVQTVPSHTEIILGELESQSASRLPSLRWFISHAETLTADQCQRWFRAVPNSRMINGFGATEVSDDSSQLHILEPPLSEPAIMSIGGVLSNLTHYVLDDGGDPTPLGVIGEVYIGGIGVGRGYLNEPRSTASVFLPDPFSTRPSARLYRIGDLAKYRADGTFEFLGRIDFQVRIRGFRIEVGEVETALSRHARVRQCVVVARADATGANHLFAYVIPDSYPAPQGAELQTFLQELLPAHAVPNHYVFLDAFPVGRTGKMSLKLLPPPRFKRSDSEYVAPRTHTERELATLWSELLQVEKVGIRDNFFALGGHSLLAARLVSRTRKLLDREIALRSLFEAPTIEGFLTAIGLTSSHREPVLMTGAWSRVRRFPPTEMVPLAPAQIPVWYSCTLAPESIVYNVNYGGLFLVGDLDVDDFIQAWQTFIDRHDAFRLRFKYCNGRPVQFKGNPICLSREEVLLDFSGLDSLERDATIERLERSHADLVFDLERGPLLRLTVVDHGAGRYQVLFVTHHIIWDEQSMMNMYAEISELYNARREGRAANLPELKLSYLDYVSWMNECLESGDFEVHRKYWLDQYADMPPALDLATDFPRPSIITYHGDWVFSWLPRDTAGRLDEYLTENNLTLFMFVLAVIYLYLYRGSGQEDIVIGCPIAGREHEDFEPLIGLFATPMPIRCRLSRQMSFAELLRQVAQLCVEAYEHHVYPATNLIEELRHVKDLSRPRLFSIMYGVQNDKTTAIGDLELTGLRPDRTRSRNNDDILRLGARFDLNFIVDQWGTDICLNCIYNTDLYRKQTVEQMVESLRHLISAVLENPGQRLSDYRLWGSELQLHPSFNRTVLPYDTETTLYDLFERQANRDPDQPALVEGFEVVTYRELAERVRKFAREIEARGVGPDDRVVLQLEPSIDRIVAMLAVLSLGACYVPVTVDTPDLRVRSIIRQSDANVAITTAACVQQLPTGMLAIIPGQSECDVHDKEARSRDPIRSDALAYIIFTSGTSGLPKAIPICHRGVVNLVAATQSRYGLGPSDRILLVTPHTFDVSIQEVFWPLSTGATIVIPEQGVSRSPLELGQALVQHRITVLQTVPIMLEALAEERLANRFAAPDSLRIIICGADALSRRIRDLARTAFSAQLHNHYGPTEVTVDATVFDCSLEFDGEITPIGRPIANVEVFILDEQQLPVPPGVPGELYISSPGLAGSYLDNEELTQSRFISLDPGDKRVRKLYRSGDRGKFAPDGTIYFIGRRDKQVKVRGNRVELEEVAQTLLSQDAIASAAVICVEREGTGNALAAYVELKSSVNQIDVNGSAFRIFTLAQRPDLAKPMTVLHAGAWPGYFKGDYEMRRLWPRLFTEAPAVQIGLVTADGTLAAAVNTVLLRWNGTIDDLPDGWNHALALGLDGHANGPPPNTLFLLTGVVGKEFRGLGLSAELLKVARSVASGLGMERILVAVRPTHKSVHPEVSFKDWCELRRADGQLMDDWLRMHERVGGRLLSVCLNSQRIEGRVADWESWTKWRPSASGTADIPGTLQPAKVDIERDLIVYYDPAVWFEHSPAGETELVWRNVDKQVLRDFMAARLPDYMVPDCYRFLERMPLTPNGTVDEQAIRQISDVVGRDRVPPRTPVQLRLAAIWERVLGIENAGITDDFFDSGGQSLKAVRLLATVEEEFCRRVPLLQFYKDSTIRGLERNLGNEAVGPLC